MRSALAVFILLLLAGYSSPARAELMLNEEPATTFTGTGWTLLLLTVTTLALASDYYSESQTNLALANQSYTNYKAATTTTNIATYREETSRYENDAESFELRANVALFLSVVFGLASYYSFVYEPSSESFLTMTPNSIVIRHRF